LLELKNLVKKTLSESNTYTLKRKSGSKWKEATRFIAKELYQFIIKIYSDTEWPEKENDLVDAIKEYDPEGIRITAE